MSTKPVQVAVVGYGWWGKTIVRTLAGSAAAALLGTGSPDEELAVARAVLALHEVDDTARKAAKAGGATWTDALHARAAARRAFVHGNAQQSRGRSRDGAACSTATGARAQATAARDTPGWQCFPAATVGPCGIMRTDASRPP